MNKYELFRYCPYIFLGLSITSRDIAFKIKV